MLSEYQILEKIATGSFGVIFKVSRVVDDGVFVMKRIDLSNMDIEQRRGAEQEIRVMSHLHHPFIVAQRDAFLFNDDSLCIVMDYYDGGDLGALITRQREKDEYLPLEQAMMWFASMCLAMQYVHAQGIVHRDLKTHNIFLDLRRMEVAIGDFGVAEFFVNAEDIGKKIASSIPTSPAWKHILARQCDTALFEDHNGSKSSDSANKHFGGAVRGTPLYMAPEMLENGVCTPSSDVWSLGCILYELLSFRHPFESRDIAALMVRVMAGVREPLPGHYPPEISELVDSMFLLDPAQRPSCDEILRSQVMKSYLHRLATTRVPRETPEMCTERIWVEQMQKLGVCNNTLQLRLPVVRETRPTALPSQERAWVERRAAVSPSSPDLFTPGDDFLQSQLPLPPQPQKQEQSILSLPVASNVEDMRHKPLAHIKEEVMRYRQLVQSEMRAQKQQRDAAMRMKRFRGDDVAMKRYYNGLPPLGVATATTLGAPITRHVLMNSMPLVLLSSSLLPSTSSHGQRNTNNGNILPPKWPRGSLEASLATRWQERMNTVIQTLGDSIFSLVYNYYKSVDVAERDATRVMQMVPDRSQWHVLPFVEEIVVIERMLERAAASGSS